MGDKAKREAERMELGPNKVEPPTKYFVVGYALGGVTGVLRIGTNPRVIHCTGFSIEYP
ncbi:hypothetical protein IMZ48_25550 [Candidatus Bathyarchaeota archaeon]|nr:hypothetical protein [Candidatus Bathyarchaeota archaeon]